VLNQKAIENCRELRKGKFKPTWFLPTSFLQCVYGAKFDPVPYVPFERERVQLKDGGALYIDWGPVFSSENKENTKILLITHGLTGSSDCNYIREVVLTAQSNGFRTVALNMRGFGDTPPIETPKYYNFADTSDLRDVISHIKSKYPKADLYGLGISIGANMIVKYAGEAKENCQFKALVSLANPYNLEKCSYKIEQPTKFIYEWSLVSGFKRLFAKNQEMLMKNSHVQINPEEVLASKRPREFDDKFTRRIHGFQTVDEYYRSVGCEPYLKDVKIPVLFINSLQDPVIDKSIIPKDEIKENGNMLLVETPQGGHIDWFTTRWPKRWAYWPAMEYLLFVEDYLKNQNQY